MSSCITEKRIYRIDPVALTTDGTSTGKITVADTICFIVRQEVFIRSSTQPPIKLKVNRVDPNDHVTMWLGPANKHISKRTDLSAYLVADGATIEANEQERTTVPEQEIERHTYAAEPTVARRVILVDPWGCKINENNPLPTTATINVGSLSIPVDIDAKDGDNIAISAHPDPIFDDAIDTVTTLAYEEIFSYTSTDDLTRISHIEVAIHTPAIVRVLLDGTVIRERITSPGERNANFIFVEHRPVPLGKVISVEAKVWRLNCPSYDTFTSLEGYLA